MAEQNSEHWTEQAHVVYRTIAVLYTYRAYRQRTEIEF